MTKTSMQAFAEDITFSIETDAAILSQRRRPIVFHTRTFQGNEKVLVVSWSSSFKTDMAIWTKQFAFYIVVILLGKGKNPTILLPAMGK